MKINDKEIKKITTKESVILKKQKERNDEQKRQIENNEQNGKHGS